MASNKQNDMNNAEWLRKTAGLLICVIANDRFGDFISDQMVAPVRETSAMAFGSVIKILPPHNCSQLINTLLSLLDQTEWQTRHGSILAIKYFDALLMRGLIFGCLIFEGLNIWMSHE